MVDCLAEEQSPRRLPNNFRPENRSMSSFSGMLRPMRIAFGGLKAGSGSKPPTHPRYFESGLDLQGTTEASTAVKTRGGVVIHKDTAEAAVAEDSSA